MYVQSSSTIVRKGGRYPVSSASMDYTVRAYPDPDHDLTQVKTFASDRLGQQNYLLAKELVRQLIKAKQAGLQPGDTIVRVNNTSLPARFTVDIDAEWQKKAEPRKKLEPWFTVPRVTWSRRS